MFQMMFGVHEFVAAGYSRTLPCWVARGSCDNLGSSFQMLLQVAYAINELHSTRDWTLLQFLS